MYDISKVADLSVGGFVITIMFDELPVVVELSVSGAAKTATDEKIVIIHTNAIIFLIILLSNTKKLFAMKTKKFLLLVVMQILVVLPLVAQELYTELEREMFGEPSELFINDIVAKPIKASTLNARDGDSINAYQAERQFIDDYLKQINPNFSAGELKVHISLSQKKSFLFEVLYKDVIVDKHKITLHQFIDTAMLITGTTLFSNDINVEPTLTLDQAVKKLQLQNNKITDESILSNKYR